MFRTAAAILAAFLLASPLVARDRGQYAQVDPEIRKWFDGLENLDGSSCCSTSDGLPLQDAEWRRNADDTYSVFLKGEWVVVPPNALLTTKSKVGYAVVWIHNGAILCFLKGPEG
jgi:hypothetical protein